MGDIGTHFDGLAFWDMAVTAGLFWCAIIWLRRSRAQAVLVGIALLGAAMVLSRVAGLQLTSYVLAAALLASFAACIVMFHGEVRRAFEQLLHFRKPPSLDTRSKSVLAESILKMAESRTGALIVFPGRRPLKPHLHGGVELQAKISEPLLLSLFDSSSPGHDGALVVRGDKLETFAAHLPLSRNVAEIADHGTRHASALGLSERCDAACIVVSEERGTVSYARDGRLVEVAKDELMAVLGEIGMHRPLPQPKKPWSLRTLEVAVAAALSGLLWWVAVPGSSTTTLTLDVPVVAENVPDGFVVNEVSPGRVRVTVTGPRRDLMMLPEESLRFSVDAWALRLGRRRFTLTEADLGLPAGVSVRGVSPGRVRLDAESAALSER